MSLKDAISGQLAEQAQLAQNPAEAQARREQRQIEAKERFGFGQGGRLAELDRFVKMSREDPHTFALLPAETRYKVGLRAVQLANRAATTGAAA